MQFLIISALVRRQANLINGSKRQSELFSSLCVFHSLLNSYLLWKMAFGVNQKCVCVNTNSHCYSHHPLLTLGTKHAHTDCVHLFEQDVTQIR